MFIIATYAAVSEFMVKFFAKVSEVNSVRPTKLEFWELQQALMKSLVLAKESIIQTLVNTMQLSTLLLTWESVLTI
jgi:hypothetical protein